MDPPGIAQTEGLLRSKIMIAEPLEEQACLYVLGLLPADEVGAFEAQLTHNAELVELLASLNNTTLALARSVPPALLPPELKLRVLDSVGHGSSNKLEAPGRKILPFVPWAIAAALAGLLYVQTGAMRSEKANLRSTIVQRESEIAEVRGNFTALEESAAAAQRNYSDQLTLAAKSQTDLLARTVALEARNSIAMTQIAVLGSLIKDRPQAVAVSVWDQEKQNGLLVVENLPVLAAGKDYQLWVLDPNNAEPVSAGVFKVDAKGKSRLVFTPNQPIQMAGKFAVTEEREGGVLAPTMANMVVIGGG
jgi:anti-sigma-K factor RskA